MHVLWSAAALLQHLFSIRRSVAVVHTARYHFIQNLHFQQKNAFPVFALCHNKLVSLLDIKFISQVDGDDDLSLVAYFDNAVHNLVG